MSVPPRTSVAESFSPAEGFSPRRPSAEPSFCDFEPRSPTLSPIQRAQSAPTGLEVADGLGFAVG